MTMYVFYNVALRHSNNFSVKFESAGTYVHVYFVTTVHGYTASRLFAQDDSDTDCNTNGETIRIWLNATHATTAPTCFLKQFT